MTASVRGEAKLNQIRYQTLNFITRSSVINNKRITLHIKEPSDIYIFSF